MKKKIISAIIVAACTIGITGFAWKEYNRYEPLQEVTTVELGDEISKDPKLYLQANKKALQDTEMDFSGVDLNKAGKYKVTAKYGKKTASFEVVVEDTVAPEVSLAVEDYKAVAGKEIKATDLIKKVEDKAGIKIVSFQENQIEKDTDSENPLDSLRIKYETPGDYTAVVEVTDNSGNTTQKEIKIKYPEARVRAINSNLAKKNTTLEVEIMESLNQIYKKHVKPEVREFIEELEGDEPVVSKKPRTIIEEHP